MTQYVLTAFIDQFEQVQCKKLLSLTTAWVWSMSVDAAHSVQEFIRERKSVSFSSLMHLPPSSVQPGKCEKALSGSIICHFRHMKLTIVCVYLCFESRARGEWIIVTCSNISKWILYEYILEKITLLMPSFVMVKQVWQSHWGLTADMPRECIQISAWI